MLIFAFFVLLTVFVIAYTDTLIRIRMLERTVLEMFIQLHEEVPSLEDKDFIEEELWLRRN